MSRSTVRSFSFGIIAAVLSLSPITVVAHADPGVAPADQMDIIYGDGDEGAIYIGPVAATRHQTTVTLAPGDVLYGDADQGAIDAGAAPIVTAPLQDEAASAPIIDSSSEAGPPRGAPKDT